MKILTLDGRLGKNAEIKTTAKGTEFISMSVANTTFIKGADKTTWYDVSIFNVEEYRSRLQYLTKGTHVFLTGIPDERAYNAKDGSLQVGYALLCRSMDFIKGSGNKENNGQNTNVQNVPQQNYQPQQMPPQVAPQQPMQNYQPQTNFAPQSVPQQGYSGQQMPPQNYQPQQMPTMTPPQQAPTPQFHQGGINQPMPQMNIPTPQMNVPIGGDIPF